MATTLHTLAELVDAQLVPAVGQTAAAANDIPVASISLNSKELGEQALFAALPGTRAHGAKYANDAAAVAVVTDPAGLDIMVQAGGPQRPVVLVEDARAALGALSAEIYGHPADDLTMIGVTGTSGKTTTTYLMEAGLMAADLRVGLIGTTGTRINGEKVPSHLTTPEAPDLHRLLATMRDRGVTHVVMEVSSHALELHRVGGVAFDTAVFLNLSQDHLDFHPTMEEYFHAKTKLFQAIKGAAAPTPVICINDDWGRRLADMLTVAGRTPVTVATEAAAGAATWELIDDSVADDGVQHATAKGPDGSTSFDVGLPGRYNIANELVAIAALHTVGVTGTAVLEAMAKVQVPGRMERIDGGQDYLAVVDYAHKPAAIGAALTTLRAQTNGRVAIVMGAGGDRDATKRAPMGAESAQVADLVVVTDDNPRSEEPAAIREQVFAGATEAAKQREPQPEVVNIGDRAEAINYAIAWARNGDTVLVAGKGHETGQQVGDTLHHFDDREEVARAISQRSAQRSAQRSTTHNDHSASPQEGSAQ